MNNLSSKRQQVTATQPTATKQNQSQAEQPQTTPSSEAEMLRLYHEQQKRMRCVGCGEGEEFF